MRDDLAPTRGRVITPSLGCFLAKEQMTNQLCRVPAVVLKRPLQLRRFLIVVSFSTKGAPNYQQLEKYYYRR